VGDVVTAKIARCQCISCRRYLARDRAADGTDPQVCEECHDSSMILRGSRPGIPLARIRGPEGLSWVQLELLGLVTEECGEVQQRVGKLIRWGPDADYAGTTQQHKLEVELGDVLAALVLSVHNGMVTSGGVLSACRTKLEKLREDRGTDESPGPRQRIRHALVPSADSGGILALVVPRPGDDASAMRARAFSAMREVFCTACGCAQPPGYPSCQCENDE
jgi:NTP pyrophosphatase (non-canonical NTP hydrolase)